MAEPVRSLEQVFVQRLRALDAVNATLNEEITKLKAENARQQKIIEELKRRCNRMLEQGAQDEGVDQASSK
jgi:predicted RNase H-like nuclease (RuvC/YqgF family)